MGRGYLHVQINTTARLRPDPGWMAMADEWNDRARVVAFVETLEQNANVWQALKERLGVEGAHEAGGASQGS
jgi:hypothetical protein